MPVPAHVPASHRVTTRPAATASVRGRPARAAALALEPFTLALFGRALAARGLGLVSQNKLIGQQTSGRSWARSWDG